MNSRPIWTITRRDESTYMAVSNIALADGRFEQDHMMELSGNVLQCIWKPGVIRIGGNTRLTLGPVSLPKVHALAVGESVTLS